MIPPPRPMPLSRRSPAAAALLAAAVASGSLAVAEPARAAHSEATLLASTDGWNPAAPPPRLALRIALAPGWHTYWSNPGDAGLAPDATVSVDGDAPAPASFRYPAPMRIPADGLMGYGYTGEVLLSFPVPPAPAGAPARAGRPLAIAVHAEWLVCAAVCVPQSADLSLALPLVPAPAPSAAAPLFARADALVPRDDPTLAATFSPAGVLRVTGPAVSPSAIDDAWFIPSDPGVIDQLAPQAPGFSPDGLQLHLRLLGPRPPARLSGLLVTRAAAGGRETAAPIAARLDAAAAAARPASAAPVAPGAAVAVRPHRLGLSDLLGLALLGGLVLNLMPCVFPILAMKALAILRHGRDGRAALRRSALLYSAGVVGSFVAVGAALLALRAAGSVAGWGFQFQSPLFVVATGWLLFAVGLNLLGALEIGGGGLAGAGQGLVARGGALGDLATGVLAVVVATPCTAPFMSVAVAGAMARSAADGVAVFAFLGIGLALPTLLIALAPASARLLPRPGAWMVRLREALSFPMFAAVVWLAWVSSVEAGPAGVLVFASGLVLIALAAWLHRLRAGIARPGARRLAASASLASLLVALSLPVGLARAPDPAAAAAPAAAGGTEPYDPNRLARLRDAGTPVFVDMSAAWCVSCLVNERVALDTGAVRARFARDGIVLMRGDWTGQDRRVTAFLRRFDREGVPLYVFYPRGRDRAPRVLPQVLTAATVLDAVDAAPPAGRAPG